MSKEPMDEDIFADLPEEFKRIARPEQTLSPTPGVIIPATDAEIEKIKHSSAQPELFNEAGTVVLTKATIHEVARCLAYIASKESNITTATDVGAYALSILTRACIPVEAVDEWSDAIDIVRQFGGDVLDQRTERYRKPRPIIDYSAI